MKKPLKTKNTVRKSPAKPIKRTSKAKNSGADTVSMAEFARRAGVSLPAASRWLTIQESRGAHLSIRAGRRGRLVFYKNPLCKRYINNETGQSIRPIPEKAAAKNSDVLNKLKYQVEKLRLTNEIERNKYLPKDGTIDFFNKLLYFEKAVFDDFSNDVICNLLKELKIEITPATKKKVSPFIDDVLKSVHTTNKRIIDDFIKQFGNQTVHGKKSCDIDEKTINIEALAGKDWPTAKAILRDALEHEKTFQLELQVKEIKNEIIPRVSFSRIMGGIYATYRTQFLDMGETIGDAIGSVLGTVEIHTIRKTISDCAYKTINEIKCCMEKYISEGKNDE